VFKSGFIDSSLTRKIAGDIIPVSDKIKKYLIKYDVIPELDDEC
jgi:hypothetical protein